MNILQGDSGDIMRKERLKNMFGAYRVNALIREVGFISKEDLLKYDYVLDFNKKTILKTTKHIFELIYVIKNPDLMGTKFLRISEISVIK